MDQKTKQILLNIKRYIIIKKLLTILCYFIIISGIIIFISHGLSRRNTIKIINDFNANKNNFLNEKVMINPRMIMQYNDNEIYNIKASKAVHQNNNEILLYEVFAEGNVGKISAGQLKIIENGDKMIFSANPLLILK